MAGKSRPSTPLPDPPPPAAAAGRAPHAGEVLGPLLRTLAESLDVREIFARISDAARQIVPHDFLMLGMLSDDRARVRVMALSGELPATPGEIAIPDALRVTGDDDTFIVDDAEFDAERQLITAALRPAGASAARRVEYPAQPVFRDLVRDQGLRSYLRVGVRLRGGVLGGLIFCSKATRAYAPADFAGARQIADCVALAIAHQRLAEEEQRAAEARERADRLEVRVQRLTAEVEAQGHHRMLGRSPAWRGVLGQAGKVAATEATVLLVGESGTGKEVLARFIHRASPRRDGPFVALNCAALPDELLESELFGNERGAFTGAYAARAGRIEQSSGGVLFLDEVGEMSAAVQASGIL